MAKIHILQGSGSNIFQAVVHAPVTVGNNAAGVSWADAIKNSGMAITSMTVGNGPGQITTNEANQIAAGTLIEAQFQFEDDPTLPNAERLARVDAVAATSVADLTARLQQQLKFFGLTRV